MNGVKEYIVPVYDVDADEFTEYIGFIRTKQELIRCKDCKWYDFDVSHRCGYTGLNGYIAEDDFCSKAEPKVKEA